jgi:TatD DNase family protein
MLVDSHAHIEFKSYDDDRDEVIARALEAGVEIIVDIGNGDILEGSHEKAQALADKYPFIYTTVGLHPHDASLLDQDLEARLVELSKHKKVIGWGEIGLDYYYDNSPREKQLDAFRRQLELAGERGLPVIIHTRDAEEDTAQILKECWKESGLGGVFHCYTGSYELARTGIEMGFYVSFSGVLTFKKSEELRSVAARLPLDRLLVETDCPYLSPEPFRGRRNEPARVREVATRLADLHKTSLETVAAVTGDNFRRLFNPPNI